MDRSELIKRLLATFLVELQDHLRVFNQELLALEQRTSDEQAAESIKTLFRTVHSLKGAARAVDAQRLAKVCHQLEEILSPLREGNAELSSMLFAGLFEAADALALAGQELQGGANDGSAQALGGLTQRLEQLSQSLAASRPPPTAAKSPASAPGTDLMSLLPSDEREVSERAASSMPPQPRASTKPPAAPSSSKPPTTFSTISSKPPGPGKLRAHRVSLLPGGEAAQPAARAEKMPTEDKAGEHTTVRVPVRRLDTLLWRSAELSIARRRFETRRDEIVAIHEAVTHLRTRLRGQLEQPLRGQRAVNDEVIGEPATGIVSGKTQRAWQLTSEALERIESDLSKLSAAVVEDVRSLERAAAPLESEVHCVRLMPFGEACEGLQRAVRDLGRAAGKEVEIVIEGAQIELDRAIIEGARSALLHLVRNAVDHGIEPPADRIARGKPPRGTLLVRAAMRGDRVEVSVTDNGRGIDLAELRQQALRRGLPVPEDERELVAIIFRPGFSTAQSVTDVSGRGVGLDVVRAQVESMRGELQVEFEPGQGTTFRLRLPLTASSLRALLVGVGEQLFAIPNTNVQALLRVGAESISRSEGREILLRSSGPIPLCSLRELLGLPGSDTRDGAKLLVVVLAADDRTVALSVDRMLAEQDLVLKPLGRRVRRLRHVSAAAVLPTGDVSLVLKPIEVLRAAYALRPRNALSEMLSANKQTVVTKRKRVLLVDDSVTTRTLEKSILDAAGYEVLTAVDGEAGFKLLQEQGADIVLSDVEMPRMDGFTLTEAIRNTKRFRDLPVVLLTSLGSEEDRARGLACGASAYLIKTSFDQENLLKTLRQLLL